MRNVFIALVCLVLFAPVAHAGQSIRGVYVTFSAPVSLPGAETDKAVAAEIVKQIRQYPFYTIYDEVEGSLQDGVVVLSGKVTMPYKASDIAERVARVPGVLAVDNRIETLPVSMGDDELRLRIAGQIYRNPLFWGYRMQPNPPIHVIVERGHVTLTGAVDSEVERRTAEAIARMTPYVFSVENKLQVGMGSEL